MVTDENLNDRSEELIFSWKQLYFKRKDISIFYMLLSIVLFILLVISCILGIRSNKEASYLSTKVEEGEKMLTLEYSIGYWFINSPEPVNDSILYQFLIDNGAWYPEILVAQAKLESGNYTSNIFKNTCNLYGMKKVGKRQTTQNGTYNGYGVYNNWCLSALDRMLWDMFTFKNVKPSREEYLKALEQYAETPNYIELINSL